MDEAREKSILLVEDQAAISEVEKLTLEKFGYRVLVARRGEQAIELLDEQDIDLVLMDVELGAGLNGIDTARLILKDHDLPIIFLSAYDDAAILEKTRNVSSYGYIMKKSAPALLEASVKMAFRLFDAMRETRVLNAKLEATLDALPDLLFEVGLDGLIHDYHSPHVEMLYEPAADIIGRNMFEIHPPEVGAVIKSAILEANEKGSSFGHQFELSVPAGTCWFEVSVSRKAVPFEEPHFIILKRDITDRKRDETRIKSLLEENDLILREVHHRIKNNMSAISSLFSLQAGTLEEPAAIDALEDAQNRVKSMMLLYDKLYRRADISSISLNDYLPALVSEIVRSFPGGAGVRLEMDVGEIELGPGPLQPLGIIVNELLTNIMKYAFEGREGGTIGISASLRGETVHVEIRDDGIGLPESIDFGSSTGFGMILIDNLTKQLGGSIRIERGSGTRIVLDFPK